MNFPTLPPAAMRLFRLLCAAGLTAFLPLLTALPVRAADEPLATLQYQILGTQLRVSPALVAVPKGIAGSVMAELVRGDGSSEGVDAALAQNAYVEAILRGPSFPARRLVGRPGEALMLPALNLVGDYQLDGIRLVDAATGQIRLEGSPARVPVQVFEEVLISRVTSRPLSMQEITDKGIVVDANNFRAVEFEVGFVLDGVTIPVRFPVVAPDFRQSTEIIPNAELAKRLVEAQRINDELARQIVDSGELPPELQRPGLNIQIKGVNFERAEAVEQNLRLGIPPIPALMVIPGNIGYLNQFFSVQVFTENGAPLNSGLSVHNVRAALKLPPGRDGLGSTNYAAPGDDPLRFARVGAAAQIQPELPILGPAPTRLARFYPGQGGSAEFLVEGLQEGLHVMDLDLTADLDGLAAGSVHIRGKAAGSVLVRNPKFSLTFSHPKTVRSGEPYLAHVTVLNTSSVEANQLSITLREASLSGGVLETPEVVGLGNLAPGQSATATYRVRAQRTGAVRFSNLTTGENSVQGRFNLTMGIDERGVELSPDSIGFPDFVNYLPEAVFAAANRVLGQALSAATAPLLPPGVKPLSRSVITKRVLELAEAGQRLKLGDGTNRVLLDLLLDWQGGRVNDEGFEQIVRETNAGREWREAMAAALEAADGEPASQRVLARAAEVAGRSEAWLLAASGAAGVEVRARGGDVEAKASRSSLSGAAVYAGGRGECFAGRGPGEPQVRFVVTAPVAAAELAVVRLGTNGTGTQWRWTVSAPTVGDCFTFDPANPAAGLVRDAGCDGLPDGSLIAVTATVTELPPEVVLVRQDTDVSLARPFYRCTGGSANNYGNVIAVLFSKPMLQANVNRPAAFQLDGGITGAGVQVQPGGRVALVSLREAISAIRPRQLTVNGVTDVRGNPVNATAKPVLTGLADGVAVNGRVLRADGSVAVGVPVTVTYYDPWKDPFDRCDPVIITRIAQKYTDTNGFFTFDFVHGAVGFTIAAVDTGGLSVEAVRTILEASVGDRFAAEKLAALAAATNALAQLGVATLAEATQFIEGLDRAVWSDFVPLESGRTGHEMTVGLRFRGRGIVAGRVVGPDGQTPMPQAAVNLFPDPDSRELVRGLFTDANGEFTFRGVPLGVFTVQVKTGYGHFRTVSGNLTQVRETNRLDIVLTAPEPREILRTSLAGRVIEPDTQAGHPRAKVFLHHHEFGLVAAVTTDETGVWTADDLPVGGYNLRAFSQDGRRKGFAQGQAVTGTVAFLTTTLDGVGIVTGRVEKSTGEPVPNAVVAGGEALVRTDANGVFRLTGVPLGGQSVSAGLEAALSPDGFPRLGSASVDVLPGVENFVVVRLRPSGVITGRVLDANGAPMPNIKVAVPLPPEGFAWVEADGLGRFTFPNMPLRDYVVSAPSPPVTEDTEEIIEDAMGRSEEEVLAAVQRAVSSINTSLARRYGDAPLVPAGAFGFTRVGLQNDGQIVEANIQFLPTGTVSGTVVNDQGVPIGARVRLTGLGLNEFGEPYTTKIGDRDSDAATGEFRIGGLPQGVWALQAANPFYPVVLVTNGLTTRDALNVSNVVMQFPSRRETNGRLVGQVLNPDGSPAGKDVRVHIDFSDDYEIGTDTNGFFDTQITVPARSYVIEATDPATGLRARTQALVSAGQTNSVTVQLLGKGALVLRVKQANGQPAPGTMVRVDQNSYPQDSFNGVTDANGEFRLENIFEGRYSAGFKFLTGAAQLEGRLGFDVARAATAVQEITLGPTGTIRGIFRKLADNSPIPFARVNLGNVVYPTTDATGRFEVTGLKLGSYRISAREPVTGRLAVANAVLGQDGQVVEVSLVELPQGELAGIVYQQGESGPIAGAEVRLTPQDGLSPTRSVTTGPDGRFTFAGTTPGRYLLAAGKTYPVREHYQTSVSGEFPATGTNQTVDLTLPRRTIYGRVVVQVFEPGGAVPATNAVVNSRTTDPAGQVIFDQLRLERQTFTARSTRPGETSSVGRGSVQLTELNTNVTVAITLSGVGAVKGRVVRNTGDEAVPGAELQVLAVHSELGVSRNGTVLANAAGEFEFDNLPLGSFTLTALDGALAAKESGTITAAGQTADVTLRLGASGSVTGRLFRADGTNVVTNAPVFLSFTAPSGLDGTAPATTDAEGRFSFTEIPTGAVTFRASILPVAGLAKVPALVSTNGEVVNLGNVLLDEAWPEVTEVIPAPAATGVSIFAPVQLVFSEPVATNSLFTNGIYLRGPTNLVAADLSWPPPTNGATRRVTLTPRQPLRSETTYRLTVVSGTLEDGLGTVIGRGPLDLVDRPLPASFSSTFTTRDDDPPVLLSAFPTNQATQIGPDAVMRLSFNEAIQDTGFTATLVGPSGPVAGGASVGFGALTLSFRPAQPLSPNATYTFTVDGVRDLAGNLLPAQPLQFTFDSVDNVGPALATLRLAEGKGAVGGSAVEVEALLAAAEPGVSVRFTADGAPIGTDAAVPFRAPFVLPSSGAVTFRAIATDRFGNDGPVVELRVNITANEPPALTLLRGAPGNAPVPTGTSFAFTVGATDDVGVTNLTVVVSGPTNVVRTFAGGATTNLQFTVPATAPAGGRVEVRARATDSLGAVSPEALIAWDVTDGTPPTVALLSPANGATVSLDAPLALTFATSDNGTNLAVRVVTSGGLAGTNDFNVALMPNTAGTNTVQVPLTGAVRSGADLAVAVAITDDGGNVRNFNSSYRLPDVEPPRLLVAVPANGATRVGLWDARRDLEFSEPLATAALTNNLFVTTNDAAVATAVTLTSFNHTVRLSFGSPLQPGTTYTNQLLPGIVDRGTNAFVDAEGNALPDGTNLVFTTAAILSVSPTNGTPVFGGDILRVQLTFEPELGARFFRFALNDGPPVEQFVGFNATNAFADFLLPLDTTNLVVAVTASDNSTFSRPLVLPPIPLRFAGNRVTNQPPVIQLTRITPASGPVAVGSTFTFSLAATDDFGVTNLTLTASGPVVTNATFASGAKVNFALAVPTNAAPDVPVHLVATARDTQGVLTTLELDIPLLAPRFPFAEGTLFYSRGPAAQGTIWAVDPSGAAEVQITAGSVPQISADGRHLLFRRGTLADVNRGDLYVRDLATGEERKLVSEAGQGIVGYDWLNDSARLIFDLGSWIDRVDRDGANRVRFSDVHGWDDFPAVYRGDGRIALHNLWGGSISGLYLLDPDGSNRRRVPNSVHGDAFPTWSPDGEWLAFLRDGNVFKIRPDGYDRTQLTALSKSGDGFSQLPAWNGDGSRILVAGTVNGTNGLWAVAASSGDLTLLRTEEGVNYAHLGRVLAPAITGEIPRLVAATPINGATGVPLWTTNVVLAFNRALASNTVSAATVAFSGPGATLTNTGSRVLLQPSLPLLPGVTHTTAVNAGLADLRGQPVPTTNVSFTTAAILAVTPTNGATIRGGQLLDVAVEFEAGLGAKFFRFALNAEPPVQVAVPAGATRSQATLLVPLNVANSTVSIVASADEAFSQPYALPPVTLVSGGNSGTNAPPAVSVALTHPAGATVVAGQAFSLRAGATSDFGVSSLTVQLAGALNASRTFTNGGPFGLSFTVPANAVPGSSITVQAQATDALGVATTAPPLSLTVAAAPTLPTQGTLFYSRAGGTEGSVWAVAADGTNDRQITTGLHPRLSPDGRQLLFGRDKANPLQKNVYVRDLLSGEERVLFSHSDFVIFYDWRADMSRVLLDFACEIDELNLDGSGRRQVLAGNCFDDAPAVNPVDGRVAFQNDRAGNGLWIASPDYASRTLVPNSQPGDYWPQWSADGQWLSFVRAGNVFRIRPDGSGLAQVTTLANGEYGDGPAVWLPEGLALAFAATVQGTNGVFTATLAGALTRVPTTPGDEIRFVGSVARPVELNAAPRLLAVTPAAGATRQPLWPAVAEFTFTEPLDPATVTAGRFKLLDAAGATVPVTVTGSSNRVRVQATAPLQPGATYTNVLLPGLADAAGKTSTLANGGLIPTEGAAFTFGTARVLEVKPTNGTPVVAGQNVPVSVTFEPPLGAAWFGFRFAGGERVVVPVSGGSGNVAASLTLPPGATTAEAQIEAADDAAFTRPLVLASIPLNVTALGADLVIEAPANLTLTVGEATNLTLVARSAGAPVADFRFADGFVPPAFAVASATAFTNGPAAGAAGFVLSLDATFAPPGSYLFPLTAQTLNGTVAAATLTVNVVANPALAVTRWKDPVNGNWSDATKWTAGVPGPSLPAVIDATGDYTVTLTADATVGDLWLGTSAGLARLNLNSRGLRVERNATIGTNGLLQVNGILRGPGSVTVLGGVEHLFNTIEAGGAISVLPGGVFTFKGTSDKSLHRQLINRGRLDWQAGRLFLQGGGSIGSFHNLPGALFEVTANTTLFNGSIVNHGTFRKGGAVGDPETLLATLGGSLTNHGTVEVLAGGLALQSSGVASGSFVIATNAALFLTSGTQRWTADSAVAGDGDVSVASGGTLETVGDWNLQGRLTVNGTARFGQASGVSVRSLRLTGTLDGTANVTVTDAFEWTTGELADGGALTLAPGATAQINGGSDRVLKRALRNATTLQWNGGRIFAQSGGQMGSLHNLAGATFEILTDQQWFNGAVVNDGLLVKPGAVRDPVQFANAFGAQLLNRGTVRVESGGLNLTGVTTHAGRLELGAGSGVFFTQANHRFEAGSEVTGAGTFTVNGGTVEVQGGWTLQGPLSVGATLRFQSPGTVVVPTLLLRDGTLGGAADVVVTGSFDWTGGTLEAGGRLQLASGSTSTWRSFDKTWSRSVENAGQIIWTVGNLFGAGTLHNLPGGVFELRGDATMHDGTLHNEGLLAKTAGSGITAFGALVQNRGEVFAGSGTVLLRGGGAHFGAFSVAPGAVLSLGAGFHQLGAGVVVAGAGRFQTESSANVRFDAGSVLDAEAVLLGSATRFQPGSAVNFAGRRLRVGGSVAFNTGATVPVRRLELDGTLDGADTVQVLDSLEWSSGTMTGAGQTLVLPDAALLLTGNDRSLFRLLANQGAAVWNAGRFFNNASGVFRNEAAATLDLEADLDAHSGRLENFGRLRKVGGTNSASFNWRVENSGVVEVNAGTLAFNGGGAHSGQVTVATGARLGLNGTHTFTAAAEVSGAGGVAQSGTTDFSGRFDVAGPLSFGGTMEFKAGAQPIFTGRSVAVPGTLRLNTGAAVSLGTLHLDGTLAGADDVTVTSALTWNGGTMRDGGVTRVPAGATLALTGFDRTLTRLLELGGSGTWDAGRFFNDANGRLRVAVGGSLVASGTPDFFSGTWENLGTFTRAAGTGMARVTGTWLNRGSFNLQSGAWWLNAAATNSGSLHLAADTTVLADGPVLALEPGMAVTGAGTLRLAGGNRLTLGTDVNFGALQVRFEGSSSVAGNFTMANQPDGLFHFDHSLTIPGSVTVGGELTVAGAGTTVTVQRVLTLLATGTLNNEGTLRAGDFIRENGNGGTINGNAPIVIGLPGNGVAPVIRELNFGPSRIVTAGSGGRVGPNVEVVWDGEVTDRFVIETSADLHHWEGRLAAIETLEPGRYRAVLPEGQGPRMFIRVRGDKSP